MMQFRSAVRSDAGTVREHNEDSAFAGSSLLMVADGVGGHAAGEVASCSATYVVSAAALLEGRTVSAAELLERALTFAHRQIFADAADRPERHSMATTATALLTDGSTFALGHIGDSRAYLYRDDHLRQITRDDSLLQDLLDSGALGPDDARTFPYRHIITRTLGQDETVELAVTLLDLRVGDRLMICSDGVTDYLTDDELADALALDVAEAADHIVATSLQAGSQDNVTCVVADVVDEPWVRPWGQLAGAGWDPANLIDGAAVRSRVDVGSPTVLTFH